MAYSAWKNRFCGRQQCGATISETSIDEHGNVDAAHALKDQVILKDCGLGGAYLLLGARRLGSRLPRCAMYFHSLGYVHTFTSLQNI